MDEITVDDAAQGYVEMLNRLGVDYIFSSPGSEFIPLWEHLVKYNSEGKKPFYVNTRHEGTALSMAKGYYMATGRCQVILTHVLTGLLHGAMELKASYTDQIPLLLIVGQNRTHENEVYGGTPGPHYLSFTEIGGQERLVHPYVKFADSPETNANILDIIQRAYWMANTEVKGPVLLNISRELLFEKTTKMNMPEPFKPQTNITADPSTIKDLVELLIQAESPLIYTRYLGRNPNAVYELIDLAESLHVPVFETPGYTNFPTNNPLHIGTSITPFVKDADLLLVIDSSSWPPWYPPKSIRSKTNAKIVFVDPDPVQLKYPVFGYPSDLNIIGDSYTILKHMNQIIKHQKIDETKFESRKKKWYEEHKKIRTTQEEKALSLKDKFPIDPIWLCHCINEVIDNRIVIVNETITHGSLIHSYIERNRTEPRTRYEATGPVAHTGLGQGMGLALGVKLGQPEKTVIALEGDGTFNYNPVLAAFGAAQEYDIPFMTVIFNNGCYAAMRGHQRYYPEGHSVASNQYYGVSCGPTTEYSKLLEAYNGYSELVEDPSRLKNALTKSIHETRNGKTTLLDVRLSR